MKRQQLPFVIHRAFPPGDTLGEILSERGLEGSAFSEQSGIDLDTVNGILSGKVAITCDTAEKIERGTGISKDFWMNLEGSYERYTNAR